MPTRTSDSSATWQTAPAPERPVKHPGFHRAEHRPANIVPSDSDVQSEHPRYQLRRRRWAWMASGEVGFHLAHMAD